MSFIHLKFGPFCLLTHVAQCCSLNGKLMSSLSWLCTFHHILPNQTLSHFKSSKRTFFSWTTQSLLRSCIFFCLDHICWKLWIDEMPLQSYNHRIPTGLHQCIWSFLQKLSHRQCWLQDKAKILPGHLQMIIQYWALFLCITLLVSAWTMCLGYQDLPTSCNTR